MALPLVGIASLIGKFGARAVAKRFGKRAVKKYLESKRSNEVATDAWEGLKSKKLNIEEAEPLRERLKLIASGGIKGSKSLFQKNIDAVKAKTRPMMERVLRGEATPLRYDKLLDAINPIKPFTYLPKITSPRRMMAALTGDKRAKIIGDKVSIKDGEKVGARLDIPAYTDVGQWVNTIHDVGSGRKAKGYSAFTYLKAGKNGEKVKFGSHSEHALRIAEGSQKKFPFAQVDGYYKNISPKKIKELAEEALKDSLGKNPTWTQVSFNPLRSGRYLNRIDPDKIIEEADEYIQVGPLVLAKNARMVSRSALNAGKYNKKINYREALGLTPDEDMKGIFGKLKKAGELDDKLFTFEEGGIVDLEPNMEDEMMDREMMDRAAQGIASRGRFGDTTLVHMSPDEVQGIEQLAGIPTTTNPDTGLPEMFSFKKLLGKTGRRILPTLGSTVGFIYGGPMGAAAGSALGTKLAGGSTQDALTSGIVTGATAGLANKIPGVQDAAGIGAKEAVAQTIQEQTINKAAGLAGQEVARSLGQQAVAGGIGALSGEVGRGFSSMGMEGPRKPEIPGLPDLRPSQRRVSYPGEGFGSGEYMYFSPNTMYAKEGGYIKGMQEGGIASIPQTEGQVDGNGDGMSDEVYGDIENEQEVALSKDEFIVPADVVSGLGNGSSNAGASKLYEMMARVRMARTGKETQPEEIEAEEFLPA